MYNDKMIKYFSVIDFLGSTTIIKKMFVTFENAFFLLHVKKDGVITLSKSIFYLLTIVLFEF